ncbi:helix-turn-helix domain-containing protein [Parasphingorhabdus sp.]|uniref:helix-turn-helix domain-containing protein n=1 Tax=Parasphingorhabdus sp. TaxID=2709688 RepID=UPI001B6DAAD3|nr:LuxR C-terminal-related transcriptional regulator [Parasphingorhabdus sp.]MBQ0770327.1 response regulator transcription factor [Sphingomonadales bacterium]
MSRPMTRIVIIYALLLAGGAFALEWLQYQYFAKAYSVEIYIILIALGFAALGIWVGHRLTTQKPRGPFERNMAALQSLGISGRELEVLEALAGGQSNKEIARTLAISPNTVKTHVAKLYAKLQVNGRVRAIEEARSLHLIP